MGAGIGGFVGWIFGKEVKLWQTSTTLLGCLGLIAMSGWWIEKQIGGYEKEMENMNVALSLNSEGWLGAFPVLGTQYDYQYPPYLSVKIAAEIKFRVLARLDETQDMIPSPNTYSKDKFKLMRAKCLVVCAELEIRDDDFISAISDLVEAGRETWDPDHYDSAKSDLRERISEDWNCMAALWTVRRLWF